MKKLTYGKPAFVIGKLLTRSELKKVLGGKRDVNSNCSASCTCPGGQTISMSISNCNGVCSSSDGP